MARRLARRRVVGEVSELAIEVGAGRPLEHGVEVDLARLSRYLRTGRGGLPEVLVGHLSHLLPVRDVIVLRCHPVELAARLDRARRGTALERRENVEAEATDVILLEALALGRRVWEVDTSGRTAESVARTVARLLSTRPPPRVGRVDWLADPAVTDYLLRPAR